MTLQIPNFTGDAYSTTAPQRIARVSVSLSSSFPEASHPSTIPSEPWYKHDPLRPTTEDILRTRSKRQRVAMQQGEESQRYFHCITPLPCSSPANQGSSSYVVRYSHLPMTRCPSGPQRMDDPIGKVCRFTSQAASSVKQLASFEERLLNNLQVFEATEEDVTESELTRYPILPCQVGVRCMHCWKNRQDGQLCSLATDEVDDDAVEYTVYPLSIEDVFDAVEDVREHLETCPNMCTVDRGELLSHSRNRATNNRRRLYYAENTGFINKTEGGGLSYL